MIEAEAPMIAGEKYSCTIELGAEILMLITSFTILIPIMFIGISGLLSADKNRKRIISDQDTSLFLSAAYALFLPLMSYLFSQAKQYNLEERAEVFLMWMVFMEIIRIRGDLIFIWDLRKSAEQLVRLFWVDFLVNSYAPLHGFRVSLFMPCIYYAGYVLLKAIVIYKAKESHLIGKNPKLIHKYMKRLIIHDNLKTTPMTSCDYIVMGEDNHEPMIKIGRVFDSVGRETCDTCLSFALAKMLRRRFAKLRLDEEGSRKALDFVLEGLIGNIANNYERNPVERVFSIIKDELKFVCDFWHMKVPIYYYYPGWCSLFELINYPILLCNGIYICFKFFGEDKLFSYVVDTSYSFHDCRSGHAVANFFTGLDKYITLFLYCACLIPITGWMVDIPSTRWFNIVYVKYKFSLERSISSNLLYQVLPQFPDSECFSIKVIFLFLKSFVEGLKKYEEPKVYSSVLDPDVETILFRMKIDVSYLACLPKWIRGKIAKSSSTICFSANAKEAILVSLRTSCGLLTNGEKSLEKYGMEYLNWACQPDGSTTKGILVWHIATTLFHHQETSHKEPTPQQNHNSFEEQEVALSLSSYCHYLVKSLPELLPDEVEWPEELYETVQKEILDIAWFFNHKPTKKDRCNFALKAIWVESSMVGMGVMLAKELMNCAENGTQVWKMLAD